MKNYWLSLLDDCVKRKRTGYSLPFLIGALDVVESNLLSINELIAEIISNEEKKVILKYCNTYKDFIFSTNQNWLYGSNPSYLTFGSLVIIPSDGLKGISDLSDIIEVLYLDYNKHIVTRKFSKDIGGEYRFYNETEEKMIKDLLV